MEARVLEILADYRSTLSEDRRVLLDSYRFVDAALKVVGVGSVGTRAFVALLLGRDGGDPLFLQVKEAQRSVLEPYAEPSAFENQGERVVQGQRLTQAASDILLGWVKARGLDGQQRDFYVRQLWDQKGSARVEGMNPEPSPPTPRSAAPPWPTPTPAAATASRSRPTSARATPSTKPSPPSPRPTRTRTRAITRRCRSAADDGRVEVAEVPA